jgi:glyoxylase-like metal-dependent hydrolase (beta-lactamase superfamily II)
MVIKIIPCGSLKVDAREMHNGAETGQFKSYLHQGAGKCLRISMNALLVDTGEQVVLFDPGCADFFPLKFIAQYGLKMDESIETTLANNGYRADQVTDVVFTHLHFDHGSGAFMRRPGRITKRFANARYHVLKEHYKYAANPDKREKDAFAMGLFKYLDSVQWLEDWKWDWMELKIFNGHTKGMVVPGINTGKGMVWYASDLIPMKSFLDPDVCSAFDLDPEIARKEKNKFLSELSPGSEIIYFHDPHTVRQFYP